VVEKDQDLQVHREAVDARLGRELKGFASREARLDTREAALAEDQKKLEETWLIVSNCELAADISHTHLDTREAGLVTGRGDWLRHNFRN
jgi:hypothetical protein